MNQTRCGAIAGLLANSAIKSLTKRILRAMAILGCMLFLMESPATAAQSKAPVPT